MDLSGSRAARSVVAVGRAKGAKVPLVDCDMYINLLSSIICLTDVRCDFA